MQTGVQSNSLLAFWLLVLPIRLLEGLAIDHQYRRGFKYGLKERPPCNTFTVYHFHFWPLFYYSILNGQMSQYFTGPAILASHLKGIFSYFVSRLSKMQFCLKEKSINFTKKVEPKTWSYSAWMSCVLFCGFNRVHLVVNMAPNVSELASRTYFTGAPWADVTVSS